MKNVNESTWYNWVCVIPTCSCCCPCLCYTLCTAVVEDVEEFPIRLLTNGQSVSPKETKFHAPGIYCVNLPLAHLNPSPIPPPPRPHPVSSLYSNF